MTKPRKPVIVNNEEIGICPVCRFGPLRASWLQACPDCGKMACRVCVEDTHDCCTHAVSHS